MKNFTKTIITVSLMSLTAFAILGMKQTQKKLQHVVAFNYKPEISPEQQQKIKEAFYQLQKDIPEIMALEGGDDINPGKKKFTQCFVVSVKNQDDLNTYGLHPKHKAFSAMVDPMLSEVMVIDYWTN